MSRLRGENGVVTPCGLDVVGTLEGIVCQHLTVARVAEGLGVWWN